MDAALRPWRILLFIRSWEREARSQDADAWTVLPSTSPIAEAASKAAPAIRTSAAPALPEAVSNCFWLAAAAVLALVDCRSIPR